MMSKKLDALTKIIERWHHKWCDHLQEWCKANGFKAKSPKCMFKLRGTRAAGYYKTQGNTCVYTLPYFVMSGKEYEETVAHEICHSFAKQIMPESKWHGDFFMFLLRIVCGYRHSKSTHNWSVSRAKKISKLLVLELKLG